MGYAVLKLTAVPYLAVMACHILSRSSKRTKVGIEILMRFPVAPPSAFHPH